ncbi:response regulator [Pseudomonas luteola]|uniref:response regulator n=1 Tax=Pseudomonas TaxID=286 RepID=UPI003DA0A7F3
MLDFESIFRASPNSYVLLNSALTVVDANEAYLRAVGRQRQELLGVHLFEAFPVDPLQGNVPSQQALKASIERAVTLRQEDALPVIRYAIPRSSARGVMFEDHVWSVTHTPLFDAEGRLQHVLQHATDISELQAMRADVVRSPSLTSTNIQLGQRLINRAKALQDEGAQLRRLFQQAPGFICVLSGPDHVFELANDAFLHLVARGDVVGHPLRTVFPELVEQGALRLFDEALVSLKTFSGRGVRLDIQRTALGPSNEIYVDFILQPIIDNGQVAGLFIQGNDVTQQKRAETELANYRLHLEDLVQERTRELKRSEDERQAAMVQAQKLEAVAKLTGGVAHDFNNVLQIIGGNLQLLKTRLAGDEVGQRRLQAANTAVERGASLASQLLSFARRQPLQPMSVDTKSLLDGMSDLLHQALGESITLTVLADPDVWSIFVDAGQLENVLVSLLLNAREAMANEGHVTVELHNVLLSQEQWQTADELIPGEYVQLIITDTGRGMSEEVKAQAFEPFFSTKREEHGTGLGLSMVYGFVKQSGGHILINSTLGKGTSITLYLPRSLPNTDTADSSMALPSVEEGGSECILVVEDDPDVRHIVVDMLSELGYDVLEAGDGQAALTMLEQGAPVDLLFTDIVMPGPVRSTELARRAGALRPSLKVLFTSGYTQDAVIQGGRLEAGGNLLSKPYRRDELAQKVRMMLGMHRQHTPTTAVTEEDMALEETASNKVLNILLVEDDLTLRSLTSEVMEELGYQVTAVASAEEALDALQSSTFDVLFTDIGLGGMSGLDLSRQALKRYPGLHVVVASGYAFDKDDELKHVKALLKPYDLFKIRQLLDDLSVR